MQGIPESFQDLLEDESKAYAFFATLMPDGSPQITPVWFSVEGEYILINSNKGRVKDRNIRNNPKVAMAIMRLDQHFRYLQIRGEVVDITANGAVEHINTLSNKYDGHDFNLPDDHSRIIFKIKPMKVSSYAY